MDQRRSRSPSSAPCSSRPGRSCWSGSALRRALYLVIRGLVALGAAVLPTSSVRWIQAHPGGRARLREACRDRPRADDRGDGDDRAGRDLGWWARRRDRGARAVADRGRSVHHVAARLNRAVIKLGVEPAGALVAALAMLAQLAATPLAALLHGSLGLRDRRLGHREHRARRVRAARAAARRRGGLAAEAARAPALVARRAVASAAADRGGTRRRRRDGRAVRERDAARSGCCSYRSCSSRCRRSPGSHRSSRAESCSRSLLRRARDARPGRLPRGVPGLVRRRVADALLRVERDRARAAVLQSKAQGRSRTGAPR